MRASTSKEAITERIERKINEIKTKTYQKEDERESVKYLLIAFLTFIPNLFAFARGIYPTEIDYFFIILYTGILFYFIVDSVIRAHIGKHRPTICLIALILLTLNMWFYNSATTKLEPNAQNMVCRLINETPDIKTSCTWKYTFAYYSESQMVRAIKAKVNERDGAYNLDEANSTFGFFYRKNYEESQKIGEQLRQEVLNKKGQK